MVLRAFGTAFLRNSLSMPRLALRSRPFRTQRNAASICRRRAFFETLETRSLLATLTWVGDIDGNWASGSVGNSNWSGDALPASGDTLIFDGTGANFTQTNTTTAGNSYSLQFTAGGYTVGGNAISLSNVGSDVISTAGTNNINLPFTMATDTIIDVGSGATVLTGGIMSGAGGLRKEGLGTLNLNALNTYTGNNVIAAGIAICSQTNTAAGGFGAFNEAATKITVLSGATVDMNGSAKGNTNGIDFVYGLTIAGSGTAGQGAFINNGTDGASGNRSAAFITLSADATVGGTGSIRMIRGGHGADTLTLNGFTLSKVGSGTFFLDNTTVTAGTIQVKGGSFSQMNGSNNMSAVNLILDDTAGANFTLASQSATVASLSGGGTTGGNIVLGALSLTVNQTATTTYNGVISGTGTVTKLGTGSLTLGGASTYNSATTLSQGTLRATSAAAFGTSTVTLGDANTLANNIQLSLLANTANAIVVSASGTGTVTISGETATATPTSAITLNRATILDAGSGGTLTLNGVVSGAGAVTKLGAGTVALGGANTFAGGTTVTAGTLVTSNTSALGTAALVMNGGTLNTSVNLANAITLNNTANTIAPNNNYRLLSGVISGPGGFTLAGGGGTPGLEINNPANSFAGNITINAGCYLRLSASEVLPDTVTVTNNGNFRMDVPGGGTETIAGMTGTGSVWVPTSNSVLQTLVVGAGNTTSSFGGGIGQGGQNNAFLALRKTGTGTFTLTGAGVYTAGTVISQGTLQLNNATAAGTGGITLGDANTAANNVTLGLGANIANPVTVSSNGTGTATLLGTAQFSGHSGTVTLQRPAILEIPASGTGTDWWYAFNGVISGTGPVTIKGGSGGVSGADSGNRVVIGGANTFTGGTVIESGKLQIGNVNAASTGTITLGTATTGTAVTQLRVGADIANTVIAAAAAPSSPSAIGTYNALQVLPGALQINHPLTLNGGSDRLTWSGAGAVWSGSADVTISGGRVTHDSTANTWTGNLLINAASTFQPGNVATLSAANNVTANGVLQLNNVAQTINALNGTGTVQNIIGANTLTVGGGNGGGNFSGVLQNGSGALSIIKAGTGTQTLSGTVGTFTGSVAVNNGTLVLSRAGAAFDGGYFPTTTTITVGTAGILNVAADWNIASTNNLVVNGGTVNITDGTAVDGVNYINNLTLNGGTVTGNPFRVGNSSDGLFLVTGSAASTIAAGIYLVNNATPRTLTINAADAVVGNDLTITGVIRDLGQNGTGPSLPGTLINKLGNGTLALPTANTYTGATTVTAGIIDISNGSALGTGAVTILGGILDLRNNITVANALTINQGGVGGILRNAAGDNAWSGTVLFSNSLQGFMRIAAGTLTVSGNITSNGYAIKDGPGTLILTGTNGGGFYMDVADGVVSLRSNNSIVGNYFHVLSDLAVVELYGGVSIPAGKTIYLSGTATTGNPTFRAVNGASTFASTLRLHNGAGTRNIGADAGSSLTITGVVNESGAGSSFTKVGLGTVTLAGSNTYTGTTFVAAGTLALQNGNAIVNTAGPANVSNGATLQLLTSETISSYVGAGDIGVGTNDSTLALGGTTLTTTGSATIGNVTTTTGGGIIAGGSIIDADDDNNITGTNIYLQAAAGIGTAVDPIETAVSAMQLNNTTSGVVNVLNSNAGALLTVSDLRTLAFGARNQAGALTVGSVGPLTLAANVTGTGAVTVSAGDTAAAGDDLTINANVILQSSGSTLTLNAGDGMTAPATALLAASSTITINLDAGSADPATGGNLNLQADLDATAAVINGGTDTIGDAITVRPDQDVGNILTPIQVHGFAPTATPTGDALTLNLTGLGTPTLTLTPGGGSGIFSFGTLAASLAYDNIENIITVPVLPYNLVVDMKFLGYENGTADAILAQISPDGVNLQLNVNAVPLFTGARSGIQSLTVIGSNDSETLTIQETTGGLPGFAGGAPVVNNAGLGGGLSAGSHLGNSADLTLETLRPAGTPWDANDVSFHFDANGGTDSIQLNLTTGANAALFSDTVGGVGSGNLLVAPGTFAALGAPSLLVSYEDLEPVTFSGGGGALLVDGTGTPALSSLTLTDIGPQTQILTDVGLPTTNVSGFGSLTVVSGDGAENIQVVSVDPGVLTSLTINAGNTNNWLGIVGGDLAADTLRLQLLPASVSALLQGAGGNDVFQLYNASNTVDQILSTVTIDGGDGNLAGNTDTLTIIDTGDTTADDVVIGAVNAAISADYFIDGITTATSSDVVVRNIDVLNYTATTGNDKIDGRFVNTTPVNDLNIVSLSGWTGGDQFLLFTSDQLGGSGPFAPTGVASGIATINLYGDALGNPNASDGTDTFGENPAGLVGTGSSNVGQIVPGTVRTIRPSVSTAINLDGGLPIGVESPQGDIVGDVLNLDISSIGNTAPVIVSSNSPGALAVSGIQPLNWTEIEDMNLIDQGKLTNVQLGDLFGRGTGGVDLMQLTLNASNANPNGVRVRVNNTVVDARASHKTVMYAGGSNDYITQANLTIPAEFYGEAGDDYISGAMANDWLSGGLGHDSINGSGGDNVIWGDNSPTIPSDPTPQDSAVGGNDILSGLGGNDVFYGGGGNDQVSAGGGNDYAYGGEGDDTLDGHDGDDRVYGGGGNDILGGQLGNDLLSGGGGNDQLYGGTGNDVIIGGTGVDLLDGGAGNDLLITGSVANETSNWTGVASTTTYSPITYFNPASNDVALLSLLTQWSSAGNRTSLDTITHDGANDDLFGGTGDDDFNWESADVTELFPSSTPPDYNAQGMGSDERFGPT